MGFLLVALAALGNVAGGLLVAGRTRWSDAALRAFVAVGAGFLLAVALLRMLPESLELLPRRAFPLVLGGYLLTHVFEHALVPHFHFGEEVHGEIVRGRSSLAAIVGLGLHSLFDGISIAAGYHLDPALGWVVFLAIALHKLPEGFTIGSIVLASGGSRRASLGAAGVVGAACLLGAALVAVRPAIGAAGFAVATGVILYVAATDLVPEVNKEVGHLLAFTVVGGAALYWIAEFLIQALLAP